LAVVSRRRLIVWGRCGAALAVVLAAGCTGAAVPPSGPAASTTTAVTASSLPVDGRMVEAAASHDLGEPPVGFTVHDRWVSVAGRTIRLAYQPMDALAASVVPEAAPSFDGPTL
jgi:hypothetical protein